MTTTFTSTDAMGTAPLSPSRWRTRIALASLSVCGLAALAWASFVSPLPRLIYNPSDSVAVGWYRIELIDHQTDLPLRPLTVGSIVLVHLPADAAALAALAAQRGYLPTRVPLLKRVGALSPQRVCVVDRSVYIDGVPVATVLPVDRMGRPLPSWQQCRQLRPGELFLLSTTNTASFDSRYFGPIAASTVIGVAHPVWLEKRP